MRWQLPGRKNLPQASLLLIAGELPRMRWVLRRLLPLQLPNDRHARKKPQRIRVPTTGRLRDDAEAQANEEKRRCARSHNDEVRQQKQDGRARRERCLKRRAPITLLGSCEKKNLIIIPVWQEQTFRWLISAQALLPDHHARNTWNDPAEQANRLLRLR